MARARGEAHEKLRPYQSRHDAGTVCGARNDKMVRHHYHYMVPELAKDQTFASPRASRSRNIWKQGARLSDPTGAGRAGHLPEARQMQGDELQPLSLLDRLLPVYIEVLRELAQLGAEWVQIDEPCLVLDSISSHSTRCGMRTRNRQGGARLKIMLATYFGGLRRQPRRGNGAAGCRVCTSTSCAAPEQLDDLASMPMIAAVARHHRRPQTSGARI